MVSAMKERKKKNRWLKITLYVATILAGLFGSSLAVTYYNYSVDSNVQTAVNLRSELSLAQNTLINQTQIILRDNETIRSLNDQLKNLNSQVNILQGQLNEAEEKSRNYETLTVKQKSTIDNLRSQLALLLVTLSGNVETFGPGTYPKSINFESEGIKYTVVVNGTGGYSIRLPNNHIYEVTIDWGMLDPRLRAGGNNVAKESPYDLKSSVASLIKDFSA